MARGVVDGSAERGLARRERGERRVDGEELAHEIGRRALGDRRGCVVVGEQRPFEREQARERDVVVDGVGVGLVGEVEAASRSATARSGYPSCSTRAARMDSRWRNAARSYGVSGATVSMPRPPRRTISTVSHLPGHPNETRS